MVAWLAGHDGGICLQQCFSVVPLGHMLQKARNVGSLSKAEEPHLFLNKRMIKCEVLKGGSTISQSLFNMHITVTAEQCIIKLFYIYYLLMFFLIEKSVFFEIYYLIVKIVQFHYR